MWTSSDTSPTTNSIITAGPSTKVPTPKLTPPTVHQSDFHSDTTGVTSCSSSAPAPASPEGSAKN